MQCLNKKGDLEFDTILKLIIGIIVLLVVIGLIFLFKDKSLVIIDKIKDLFRFGV
jgi:hypothetical protein